MGDLYDKWRESVITVYESHEMSTLNLLDDITSFNGEIAKGVDNLNNEVNNFINETTNDNTSFKTEITNITNSFKSEINIKYTNADNRLKTLEKDNYFPITNNGDNTSSTTTITSVIALYPQIQGGISNSTQATNLKKWNMTVGEKWYLRIRLEATSEVNIDRVSTNEGVFTIGENSKNVSGIRTVATTGSYPIYTQPVVGQTGNLIYKDLTVINLTETFGAGNEPTKEEMDKILSFYPNNFFNGTVNLAENSKFMKFLLNEIRSKASVKQEEWKTPTLLNGWTSNTSITSDIIGFYKDTTGIVRLRGIATSGTSTTNLFVLPVGYRPKSNKFFICCCSGNAVGRVDISSVGNVAIYGFTSWISLEQISFKAE